MKAIKRNEYSINAELKCIAWRIPYNSFMSTCASVFLHIANRIKKIPDDLEVRRFTISGHQKLPVPVELIEPKNNKDILPVMIFIHGGAFSYPAAPYHIKLAYRYAQEIPCRVILPDYHLSPRYTYPVALNDNLAVYKWIMSTDQKLRIDTDRIIVTGDSAGAALASCVVNRCEKEQLVTPCGQMLIYPVTDASLSSESMKKYRKTPLWNAINNEKMWKYYLKGKNETERKEAAPMDNELPTAIPKTYIEVTEYDCLHDEGIAYADKLKAMGAEVIVNETSGTFHGYDSYLKAAISKENINKRIQFLKGLSDKA